MRISDTKETENRRKVKNIKDGKGKTVREREKKREKDNKLEKKKERIKYDKD